jgi:hypothetical protein
MINILCFLAGALTFATGVFFAFKVIDNGPIETIDKNYVPESPPTNKETEWFS